MSDTINIRKGSLEAKINTLNQQLFSLSLDGTEFMWGGGKPEKLKTPEEKRGWQNSEIVMFPIMGAAKNDEIIIDGKNYPMGQHGIARYLNYRLMRVTDFSLAYIQEYTAGTEVRSPKGNFKFPRSYKLCKQFVLEKDELKFWLAIDNISSKPFPYALGWHPAFKVPEGSSDSYIQTGKGKKYSIEEIKQTSTTGALRLKRENKVDYVSKLGRVHLTSNFGNLTVWSPEENLICLEPVTALTDREYLGELKNKSGYNIMPSDGVLYWAKVQVKKTK